MPFTVTHASGMTRDSEFQEYYRWLSRVLLKEKIHLDDVPRYHEPGTENRWLYVWATEAEAKNFADLLNQQTGSGPWVVRAVNGTAARGPLRPLEIQVGWQRDGWTFALAPWARKAIQNKYPGSCLKNSVFIALEPTADPGTARRELRELAGQMLPVLTGLTGGQLRTFVSYVATDPVNSQELVSATPIPA